MKASSPTSRSSNATLKSSSSSPLLEGVAVVKYSSPLPLLEDATVLSSSPSPLLEGVKVQSATRSPQRKYSSPMYFHNLRGEIFLTIASSRSPAKSWEVGSGVGNSGVVWGSPEVGGGVGKSGSRGRCGEVPEVGGGVKRSGSRGRRGEVPEVGGGVGKFRKSGSV